VHKLNAQQTVLTPAEASALRDGMTQREDDREEALLKHKLSCMPAGLFGRMWIARVWNTASLKPQDARQEDYEAFRLSVSGIQHESGVRAYRARDLQLPPLPRGTKHTGGGVKEEQQNKKSQLCESEPGCLR
jgi:hypothetical protein